MNKKVLILSGSPRKNGNSDILCEQFKKGAEEAGNTVEKVYVHQLKIGSCPVIPRSVTKTCGLLPPRQQEDAPWSGPWILFGDSQTVSRGLGSEARSMGKAFTRKARWRVRKPSQRHMKPEDRSDRTIKMT